MLWRARKNSIQNMMLAPSPLVFSVAYGIGGTRGHRIIVVVVGGGGGGGGVSRRLHVSSPLLSAARVSTAFFPTRFLFLGIPSAQGGPQTAGNNIGLLFFSFLCVRASFHWPSTARGFTTCSLHILRRFGVFCSLGFPQLPCVFFVVCSWWGWRYWSPMACYATVSEGKPRGLVNFTTRFRGGSGPPAVL